MNANDIIYTDGEIIRFNFNREVLKLWFKDYEKHTHVLTFSGIEEVIENGSIGILLSDCSIKKDNGKLRVYFSDDESTVLTVLCKNVELN